MIHNPFAPGAKRPEVTEGVFSPEEVALANRNSGALLETLGLDITPTGTHYLLNHFDVPVLVRGSEHMLSLRGRVRCAFFPERWARSVRCRK